MNKPRPNPRTFRQQVPAWVVSLGLHLVLLIALGGITWLSRQEHDPPPASINLQTIERTDSNDPLDLVGDREQARDAMGQSKKNQPPSEQPDSPTTTSVPIPRPPTEPALQPPAPTSTRIGQTTGQAPTNTDPAMAMLAEQASDQQTPAGLSGGPKGAGLEGTSPGFQRMVQRLQRRGIDLVLVLDATDSMQPYIAQAKQRLRQIIGVMSALAKTGEQPQPRQAQPRQPPGVIPVRVGLVAFKDYGDEYGVGATRRLPLTDERNKVMQTLDQITPGGGGDDPEPIQRALAVAIDPDKMDWDQRRERVLILVTDAPIHGTGKKDAYRLAGKFARGPHARLTVIDVGGADQTHARDTVLADLQHIADAAGGDAFVLTQKDAFWRQLITGIFGKRYEQDVQTIVKRYGGAAPD